MINHDTKENFYQNVETGFFIDQDEKFIPIREDFPYLIYNTLTSVFPFVKYEEYNENLLNSKKFIYWRNNG